MAVYTLVIKRVFSCRIAYDFYMGEHGGTHIDAPIHMWKKTWSVDEIPLERLLNLPLVVVDVTKKVEHDPDYAVSSLLPVLPVCLLHET